MNTPEDTYNKLKRTPEHQLEKLSREFARSPLDIGRRAENKQFWEFMKSHGWTQEEWERR